MQSRSIEHVTLDQLTYSGLNVRSADDLANDKGLETLAASIASVGLLAPLVVGKPKRKGAAHPVYAGRRRLAAIKLLAERDPAVGVTMIPVVIVANESEATEVSMAENYAREQMTLPEVYDAFAALRAQRPTASFEDLGAMFGYDAARVARIMRIAGVSTTIKQAWRAGTIKDEAVYAYASTEDQALQDRVFAALTGWQANDGRAIRTALGAMTRDQAEVMAIVGIDAYRAAGGGFEADLLSKDGEGRILDEDILNRLFDQKIAEVKDEFEHSISRNGRVLGDKWGLGALDFGWAEKPPTMKQYGSEYTDHDLRISNPKRSPFTPEQKANVESYKATIAGLEERLEALPETDESEAEATQIEELIATHQRMIANIEATRTTILPKKGKVVGVIDIHNGALRVTLWYASRAEKGLAMPAGATAGKGAKPEPTPGEKHRKREGLSKDAEVAMHLLFRDMVAAQLYDTASRGSQIAGDALLFTQAWSILNATPGYGGNRFLAGNKVGIITIPSDDGRSTKVANIAAEFAIDEQWAGRENWLRSLPAFAAKDPVAGFNLFRDESDEHKQLTAAYIMGHMMRASTGYYQDPARPRMLDAIAMEVDRSPERQATFKDMVTLNEKFFERLSHKRRCEILTEWGLEDRAKVEKSGTTAALCARVQAAAVTGDDREIALLGIASIDLGDVASWLPDWLDTRTPAPLPEVDEDEPLESEEDLDEDEDARVTDEDQVEEDEEIAG